MNRKIRTVLISVVLVLILTIVFGWGEEEALSAETRIVVDQLGRKVEISKDINRIVTLPIPHASLIYCVDGKADRIAGMHPVSMKAIEKGILGTICPRLKSAATNFVVSGFEINIEELLKLKPDIVFQWAWMDKEIKKIEEAGIPVIALTYGTQEDLETWITILGEVLGKEEKASQLIKYHREVILEITYKAIQIPVDERPKVLYLPYGEQLKTTGTRTYNQFWINITGGKNVAEGLEGWKNVNMEQILKWDPDIIYIGNFCELLPEDILENRIDGQDWSQIEAVKNRRVYKVPLGGYRWDPPNQESPLMLKWLLGTQHSNKVDYKLKEDIKKFYLRFYNYELSEEQVSEILHCKYNQELVHCK